MPIIGDLISGSVAGSGADAAEVFAFVGQDFDDPPDYFVTDLSFRLPRQITAVNPFHTDYAWGHSELIQYTNHRGRKLQGALFYPANYDSSISYPMITYVYEIRSQFAKQYADLRSAARNSRPRQRGRATATQPCSRRPGSSPAPRCCPGRRWSGSTRRAAETTDSIRRKDSSMEQLVFLLLQQRLYLLKLTQKLILQLKMIHF